MQFQNFKSSGDRIHNSKTQGQGLATWLAKMCHGETYFAIWTGSGRVQDENLVGY